MAKKLNKTEISTISKEIGNRIAKINDEKRDKRSDAIARLWDNSREKAEFESFCTRFDVACDNHGHTWFLAALKKSFVERNENNLPPSPKSFNINNIEHEISLGQIEKDEDFNLQALIETLVTKYTNNG